MTELIYVPSQLDLLAAAVIKRAHLDTRGLLPTKRAVKRVQP